MWHGEWWWIVGLLFFLGALLAVLMFLLFAKRPQSDATKQVSLGCGKLILIAAIVLVGSRAAVNDLEYEVSRLRTTVEDLKKSVDSQTGAFRELQAEIKNPQQAAGAEATKQE